MPADKRYMVYTVSTWNKRGRLQRKRVTVFKSTFKAAKAWARTKLKTPGIINVRIQRPGSPQHYCRLEGQGRKRKMVCSTMHPHTEKTFKEASRRKKK